MDNEHRDTRDAPEAAKTRFDAIKGIVGPMVFFGCWIYAVVAYGFFFGIALGWVAALAVASIVVFVLPHLIGFSRRIWHRLQGTARRDR